MASNGLLYGLVGALGVAVVGGGLYIADQKGAFNSTSSAPVVATAPAPAPVAPAPAPVVRPPVATPQPAPQAAVPNGPTAAQVQQLNTLVVDARRAITRGDFNSADRALDQAERIDPHSSDVIAARRDLRDAQQHASASGQSRRRSCGPGARGDRAARLCRGRPLARRGRRHQLARPPGPAGPRRVEHGEPAPPLVHIPRD